MRQQHIRPSPNFVNLGNLYSTKPWWNIWPRTSAVPRETSPVYKGCYPNLGTLYSQTPFGSKTEVVALHKHLAKCRDKNSIVPLMEVARKAPNAPNAPIVQQLAPQSPAFLGIRYTDWAYFDDGSVFVSTRPYREHHDLETRLKIAAHCVREPTLLLRKEDMQRRRLIIVDMAKDDPRYKSILYYIRKARDGEKINDHGAAFRKVLLTVDETGELLKPIEIGAAKGLKGRQALQLQQMMAIFRGTLIDGKLRPDLRLGNGLFLDNMAFVRPAQEDGSIVQGSKNTDETSCNQVIVDSKRLARGKSSELSAPVSRNRLRKEGRGQQEKRLVSSKLDEKRLASPTPDDLAMETSRLRTALLETKERELHQREEALRWKRKASTFEQKIAQMAKRTGPKPRKRPLRRPYTSGLSPERTPGPTVDQYAESVPISRPQESGPSPEREPDFAAEQHVDVHPASDALGADSAFESFDMDDPAPPRSLARIRSHMKLPSKQILAAKGES